MTESYPSTGSSRDKREALLAQLRQRISNAWQQSLPPAHHVSANIPAPLSYAQRRPWLLEQLAPGNPIYNIPLALHLHGLVDIPALESSINAVVSRHDALRTRFVAIDGSPMQIVSPVQTTPLPVVRLDNVGLLAGEDRRMAAQRYAATEAKKPFDLTNGPMIRAQLLCLDAEEHVLLVTLHHIAADGWSVGVFLRELAAYYAAALQSTTCRLPTPTWQYPEYALWQSDWLQSGAFESHLAYWKRQLSELPPLLEIPGDRPRPAQQTFAGDHVDFELSHDVTWHLKELSRREQVTPFMVLLAAFALLIYRYTECSDLFIGTPIVNRSHPQFEDVIGYFVNTLVLRLRVSGTGTARDLLHHVRDVALDAYEHQEAPFDRLVEELMPARHLSYNPLFQVMFAFHNTPPLAVNLAHVDVKVEEIQTETSKVDLTFDVTPTPDGLRGVVEYRTDIFERETIRRMVTHFQTLLEAIIADPDEQLERLPMLPASERQRYVIEWNATERVLAGAPCLHQVFEVQASRTPDAIAVVSGDTALTYRDLDRHANQLAHYLRRQGVVAGMLVGICMERSLDLIVGIMGILKAGGGYVPIDPTYPAVRIRYMIADADLSVVITQQSLLHLMPDGAVQLLCLDRDWPTIAQNSEQQVQEQEIVTELHPAMILYTSGSTGEPKGVVLTHAGWVNYVHALAAIICPDERDRILQFSSISFDASAEEIFLALSYGATLVLRPPEMVDSSARFFQICHNLAITVLDLPTGFWQELVDGLAEGITSLPPMVRAVEIGGQQALPRHLAWWQQAIGERVLFLNAYGPTEATVAATVSCGAFPTIGRPVANTQVYLLDRHLQPVPIGVPGDLYIGGAGLARGYLHQPALTAAAFLPHPFSAQPGARLYCTGDRARYRPDGQLEFLGRRDAQVKLRGFRVEPAEIEAALGQHPDIVGCCVQTYEDTPGSLQLVAYVVANSHTAPSTAALRSYLGEKLPHYMVPHTFIPVAAFPLTPHGKINRQMLPRPDSASQGAVEGRYDPPRTASEALIARVWEEVLRVPHVGIYDNFFELGGDSLLSLRIVHKLQQDGLLIGAKEIFEYQTVAGLASVAKSGVTMRSDSLAASEPHYANQTTTEAVNLIPLLPQQLDFFERITADIHHRTISGLFAVRKALTPDGLTAVADHLVAAHEALRIRFAHTGVEWRQRVAPQDTLPAHWLDFSAIPSMEQSAAIEREAARLQNSLNLSSGPLARLAYFDLGPNRDGRLLLILHHLIGDAVSWAILVDDLQRAYAQVWRREPVFLPTSRVSLRQWSLRLHDYAHSDDLARESINYWLSRPWERVSRLPVNLSDNRPPEQSGHFVVRSCLSIEESRTLRAAARVLGVELQDVLLGAIGSTLASEMNQPVLLVDIYAHGRNHPFAELDITRTVGWFATRFPLLLDLTQVQTTRACIQVVASERARVPQDGVGYGILKHLEVREDIRQRMRELPAAEIAFNYLGRDGSQFDQEFFAEASESPGSNYSPRQRQIHTLPVVAFEQEGMIELIWHYDGRFLPETVSHLADATGASLRQWSKELVP